MPPKQWIPVAAGTEIRLRSNPLIVFKIPPVKINMGNMKAQTPDVVSGDSMHQMLKDTGLDCEDTTPAALQPTVDKVSQVLQYSQGFSSTYLIDKVEYDPKYKIAVPRSLSRFAARGAKLAAAGDDEGVAKGEWRPSDTALGYSNKLAVINAYFTDLYDNYPGFNNIGHIAVEQKSTEYVNNTQAISDLFVKLAIVASGEIVTGINEPTMSASLSNIIAPALDPSLKDYDQPDNRIIFIVFNLDPATGYADGVGFIYLTWNLKIVNYKNKTKDGGDKHETTIVMNAQSVVYSDIDILNEHYYWVKNRHQMMGLMLRGIPPVSNFKIFDALPPLGDDTWYSALLLESKGTQLTGLVFYAADLTCLGSLDNKASLASSTYSIATTSGFTFSMEQKIGVSTEVAADVIFAKASVTFSLELTFGEQWNTSTTETIEFEVPGKASAFVYKGFVMSRYIYFNPQTIQYSWGTEGKFYSNALLTSETALTGDPIYKSSTVKKYKV